MSTYYWYDNRVHHSSGFPDMPKSAIGCFCIDLNCPPGMRGRVGQWGPYGWKDKTPDELPVEFRSHLLLMGIPT